MVKVISLFSPTGQLPAQVSPAGSVNIDVGCLAWMRMHDIRAHALAIDSRSGQVLVARELVASRYAAPGEGGRFRAIAADTALRRAVDLMDLADELDELARGADGVDGADA